MSATFVVSNICRHQGLPPYDGAEVPPQATHTRTPRLPLDKACYCTTANLHGILTLLLGCWGLLPLDKGC